MQVEGERSLSFTAYCHSSHTNESFSSSCSRTIQPSLWSTLKSKGCAPARWCLCCCSAWWYTRASSSALALVNPQRHKLRMSFSRGSAYTTGAHFCSFPKEKRNNPGPGRSSTSLSSFPYIPVSPYPLCVVVVYHLCNAFSQHHSHRKLFFTRFISLE